MLGVSPVNRIRNDLVAVQPPGDHAAGEARVSRQLSVAELTGVRPRVGVLGTVHEHVEFLEESLEPRSVVRAVRKVVLIVAFANSGVNDLAPVADLLRRLVEERPAVFVSVGVGVNLVLTPEVVVQHPQRKLLQRSCYRGRVLFEVWQVPGLYVWGRDLGRVDVQAVGAGHAHGVLEISELFQTKRNHSAGIVSELLNGWSAADRSHG